MPRIVLRVLTIGLLLAALAYLTVIQQLALDAGPNVGYEFVYDGLGIINIMILLVIVVIAWEWRK